jgi:hypothetical protein
MTTSIVSAEDYFGQWITHPDVTAEVMAAVRDFLPLVNDLLQICIDGGVVLEINPRTKTYVAGETYGGFRPSTCPQGAPASSHKVGRGVDIYDPHNELDGFLMLHQKLLKDRGLFIENPDVTIHWCHLTNRAPNSGKTVFNP